MPPHLGGGSIQSGAFQPVALHQPLLFARAIPVLAHVVDLSPDHHEPGRAQLEGGLDAGGRIDVRVVEANLVSQRHQEHWDHVGGPGRKHAMGASLAAPDRGIVHARQIVEAACASSTPEAAGNTSCKASSRKILPAATATSAPAMPAAKHRVAGGAGDFRVGLLGKGLGEEILDRAPRFCLGGIEVLTDYNCP
jgi:hypothetical protein